MLWAKKETYCVLLMRLKEILRRWSTSILFYPCWTDSRANRWMHLHGVDLTDSFLETFGCILCCKVHWVSITAAFDQSSSNTRHQLGSSFSVGRKHAFSYVCSPEGAVRNCKGVVHPQILIMPIITHPHIGLNPYEFNFLGEPSL